MKKVDQLFSLFRPGEDKDWVMKLLETECIEQVGLQTARRSMILPKNEPRGETP